MAHFDNRTRAKYSTPVADVFRLAISRPDTGPGRRTSDETTAVQTAADAINV